MTAVAEAPVSPHASLLVTSEVADRLGLDDETIRRWAKAGLPHARLPNGVMLFRLEAVVDWSRRPRSARASEVQVKKAAEQQSLLDAVLAYQGPSDPAWQLAGNCSGHAAEKGTYETFFPTKNEWSEVGTSPCEEAKAVCQGCPVRIDCLVFGLQHEPQYGVWGGLSVLERRKLNRMRRRRGHQWPNG